MFVPVLETGGRPGGRAEDQRSAGLLRGRRLGRVESLFTREPRGGVSPGATGQGLGAHWAEHGLCDPGQSLGNLPGPQCPSP